MASLRDCVKENQEYLSEGIAWVAFWKEGRSWYSIGFFLELNENAEEVILPEQKRRLETILIKDPKAVILNGYLHGHLGTNEDGEKATLANLYHGVRWHYQNGTSSKVKHFLETTDVLYGEYDAFCHIVNNCSGVIREKVNKIFSDRLSDSEQREICTLIYYPNEKLSLIKKEKRDTHSWYRMILNYLIELSRVLSSKYTRLKVRKALPQDFSYIIDELIHIQKDEEDNQIVYHENILDTIININNADEFIVALSELIKRLAVDHLHIVGDIFDRGPCADKIMDMLICRCHSKKSQSCN